MLLLAVPVSLPKRMEMGGGGGGQEDRYILIRFPDPNVSNWDRRFFRTVIVHPPALAVDSLPLEEATSTRLGPCGAPNGPMCQRCYK